MKRIFDVGMALLLLCFLALPIAVVAIIIKITSEGPVLHWSDRVGLNNTIFKMPKFRTMKADTPQVPTHLLENPDLFLTKAGKFLRKTSLDELPQLYSILKRDMSFVGPRPALFNQHDLIKFRTMKGVHKLTPGLTGWAQINGRDDIPIPVKVDFDKYYMEHRSFFFDIKILWITFFKVAGSAGIKH